MSEQVNNNPNPAKVDTRKTEINKGIILFNKLGIWVIVIALVVLGMIIAMANKGSFFGASNVQSILEAVALQGMVCSGLIYVVYAGNMNDMSIPLTMAMAGMMTVQSINLGFPIALAIGLLSGVCIGLINGFMIGKLKANPIIWTWGFNLLLSGIIRVVWGGKQLYADSVAADTEYAQNAANTFYSISRTYIGGVISLMAIVMLVLFVISWFIHSKTSFGQKLKMVGTSYEAARFSGINCTRIMTLSYVLCSTAAAVGGIFYAALRKTASYENGTGYDFSCLTCVLLGGTLLGGGQGSVVGTLGGVLAYGILNNILSWVGLGTYTKYAVQGVVFLAIVWINTYSERKLGKG
ncbi:MAG: ABC transporter permease [Lachnospiraceae bacterium]|jgi:ribose/xylose/arabinose/galactoside ABC-type transport system permease subunit|nr:ABC transporter permease [Lachnospiraceae bacterium]